MWYFYINKTRIEVNEEEFSKLIKAFDWIESKHIDDYLYCEVGGIEFALTKKFHLKNPYDDVKFEYR